MLHTSVICLFCEDIREEKNGTDIIIGIYPDNINMAQVPGMFIKLGLYARIQAPASKPPLSLSLRLESPGSDPFDLGEMPSEKITEAAKFAQEKGAPYIGLIMKAVLANFPIHSAGRLSAIARLDDEEYLAGTLNVVVKEETPSSEEA